MVADSSSDQRQVIQASEILAKIERGEDIEYDGVIIEGDLDISGLKLRTEQVSKTKQELRQGLSEELKVIASEITLINSEIRGKVNFSNTHFRNTISFREAKFTGGDVCFRGTQFGGWYTNFVRAKFTSGIASFEGVEFDGYADFDGAEFTGGNTDFRGAKFAGWGADFDGVEFGGDASFDGAKFTDGDACFRGAKFGRYAGFVGAEFTGGNAEFKGAEFTGGNAYFVGAEFTGGDTDFRDVKFAGGNVDFRRAEFGRYVGFKGAKLTGGDVYFEGSEITGGNAYFNGAEFTGGKAYFDYLQFHQDLSFKDTKFGDSASQEVACRIAKRKMEDLGNKNAADYYFYREMEAVRILNGIEGTEKLTWPWKMRLSDPYNRYKEWIKIIGSKIWRFGRYNIENFEKPN